MRISVSIVEDHEPTRTSFSLIINGAPGFRCVSSHADAEDALEHLPIEKVEVVLVDIGLPGISGIDLTRKLKERKAGLHVVILTVHTDSERVFGALKAGADGYLLKRTPPAQVLGAITDVHSGGAPMTPGVARKVLQHFHQLRTEERESLRLTRREKEILEQLAKGFTNKELANNFRISVDTVRSHVGHILAKLHVTTRTAAVAKFLAPPVR